MSPEKTTPEAAVETTVVSNILMIMQISSPHFADSSLERLSKLGKGPNKIWNSLAWGRVTEDLNSPPILRYFWKGKESPKIDHIVEFCVLFKKKKRPTRVGRGEGQSKENLTKDQTFPKENWFLALIIQPCLSFMAEEKVEVLVNADAVREGDAYLDKSNISHGLHFASSDILYHTVHIRFSLSIKHFISKG